MAPSDILTEIKMRLDIIDIISEYVNLKKAGSNFKGLCPFHSEKTPSFTVSPSKQFYYCFGCGESGDMITFLQKMENLTFQEAIERLANRAGIAYKPVKGKSEQNRMSLLLSLLNEAGEFYRKKLAETVEALDYLIKERKLLPESIENFSLGFAPKEWDSLLNYLKNKGYREIDIKDAGLLSYSEKGSYDLFRGRIIFPIFNIHGRITGFGGRVMDDSLPKYLNSPETPLFKKGESLFGLFQAREGIKKYGFALITEGYLDVIMCHQHGFTNAVAPLGTALTEKQVMLLRRMTDRIVLLYDGDSAGISAAKRAIPILLECSLKPLVSLLPEGEDPDSFLKTNPSSSLQKILESPLGLVEFYMKIAEKQERIETLKELTGLIARIDDPIIRGEYIKTLSQSADFKEEFLIEEIKRIRSQGGRPVKTLNKSESKGRQDTLKLSSPEALLLAVILKHPEKAGIILKTLSPEDIEEQTLRNLYSIIIDTVSKNPSLLKEAEEKILFENIINIINTSAEDKSFNTEARLNLSEENSEAEVLRSAIAQLTFSIHLDKEGLDKLISDCLKQIRLRTIDRLIQDARSKNDLLSLNRLLREKTIIQNLKTGIAK
ncbi:MAG: DNA primase [Thermodesulfovibrionales bacterium]|nr:DNA primase [Thermodesulfovibrionales bacterium]